MDDLTEVFTNQRAALISDISSKYNKEIANCSHLGNELKTNKINEINERRNSEVNVALNSLKEEQKKQKITLLDSFKSKYKELKSPEKVSEYTKNLKSSKPKPSPTKYNSSIGLCSIADKNDSQEVSFHSTQPMQNSKDNGKSDKKI